MDNFHLFIFLALIPVTALGWSGSDFKAELTSPWTTKARTVFITGVGVTVVSLILEDNTDRSQDELVEDRPLGDLSRYGDWAGQMVPNIAYIIGQSIASTTGDKLAHDRAIGMFKATAYATGITTALKYSIREPRPDNHKDHNSFPSGHSTTAFAFGGYIFAEHGWQWGVPALILSTLTGISRINDNRHRYQDVFAGATIGLSYGLGISYLAKKNNGLAGYNIVPIFESGIKGLVVMREF